MWVERVRVQGAGASGLRAPGRSRPAEVSMGPRRLAGGARAVGPCFLGPISSIPGAVSGATVTFSCFLFLTLLDRRQREGLVSGAAVALILGGTDWGVGESPLKHAFFHVCGHVATPDYGESLISRTRSFAVSALKGLTPCLW